MGNIAPIPRLGVGALKLHDAGNGFRNNPYPAGKSGTSTLWPSSLSFGATWDAELVRRVAAAIGKEYRGKGSNVILGPAVQVHRVARNGRNFEYMSGEDPYLGAQLSAAYVRGVQGQGVMATLKHYAFNEQETNRNSGNSVVDDRTAWEIYYPPFEAGVHAGAGSIMCSYNRVNGTYACGNEELLNRDLKDKMGFKGFVMSDWWALQDEPEQSVVRGFDNEQPCAGWGTKFTEATLEALETKKGGSFKGLGRHGQNLDSIYRDPAFRVLAASYKLRLFERPSCRLGTDCVAAIDSDQRCPEHSALSRDVTTKSVVLLQNDGLLPLKAAAAGTLPVLGLIGLPLNATSGGEGGMGGDYYSGGGSGHCVIADEDMITPFMALKKRAEKMGYGVVQSLDHDLWSARRVAQSADVVIVVAATTSGESQDRPNLDLDFNAEGVIRRVAEEKKPIVVLVQAPGTVLLPWRSLVSAIGIMFLGGEHTSSAWEAVVFGDVAPSGKLPLVLPKEAGQVIEPALTPDINYAAEGLFTSYRSRRASEEAAFPFGHGLSYTNFTYGVPKQVPKKTCTALACVSVTISNAGTFSLPAAEVAQAYIEFPPEKDYPKLMLKGFYKTQGLKPGETETAMFNFTARDLSIYEAGDWRLQSAVIVHVGASSADIRGQLSLKGYTK